ncbi:hypothetical protein QMA67_14625 [Gluconobacter japonicus]|uniref:hypothetical protein n=1 Tax=Gluconobacter japonicus TaxID=376620 RepID=UPI0024AE1977|nr:hypothetical protein [Gluconobacter japonicus]MDI6654156.1 hypothetical protein [Gluconobacter japonicus]
MQEKTPSPSSGLQVQASERGSIRSRRCALHGNKNDIALDIEDAEGTELPVGKSGCFERSYFVNEEIVVGVEPVALWAEPRLWSACMAVHQDASGRETAVHKSTGFTLDAGPQTG